MRCIVDTNVLVSAVVLSNSVPRRAVEKVLHHGILLLSDATSMELREVLSREKFDRYVSRKERALFLAQLAAVSEAIPIVQLVPECRTRTMTSSWKLR
jgi:predicted nucleic acid-binding protein